MYLDALGAQRIPDPTTAGDFCRRFKATDVEILMNTINDVRVKVWQRQPKSFLEEAIIEGDAAMAETTGQCKQGMDINHEGNSSAACSGSYTVLREEPGKSSPKQPSNVRAG